MSDSNTVSGSEGTDVTFTHVASDIPRAKGVSEKVFRTTYIVECKAGKTNQEIASQLGMNLASLISRASATRKILKGAGVSFPFAKTNRGSGGRTTEKMGADEVAALLKSLDAPNVE